MELWCICVLVCVVPAWSVLVDTEYGPVEGQTFQVNNGRSLSDVATFVGIPFAHDTSGEYRFKMPGAPEPWTEPLQAFSLKAACPQRVSITIGFTHRNWTYFDEDCLHINIYAPADFETKSYPVLYWVHGGGFQLGMNNQYAGYFLATYGVVVASVNYRLNTFGFAYTGNEACPGNIGLFDQKFGLEWVIRNIANFGGDPNRITVAGESAGAASAAYLVISPHTKHLFQQAILESGTESSIWGLTPKEAEPENVLRQVAADVGCPDTAGDDVMMACLRNLTWEEIYDSRAYSCPPGYLCGFYPVIDGPGGFLPKPTKQLREEDGAMQGPIITGVNHDELGPLAITIRPGEVCCSNERLRLFLRGSVLLLGDRVDNVTRQNMMEALEFNYSPWAHLDDPRKNRDELIQWGTDLFFGYAFNKLVVDHSSLGFPTFGYEYNYRGRGLANIVPEEWGVMHAMELPYVWGFPLMKLEENELIYNQSQMRMGNMEWTNEDIEHTTFFQEMYTNFIKTGDPTPYPVNNPSTVGGTTTWPQYNLDQDILKVSNVSIGAGKGREEDYAFWNHYLTYVSGGEAPYALVDPDGNPLSLEDFFEKALGYLV